MIINLMELIEKERSRGYSDANASAKVCQDIVLKAISISDLNHNITIKGGVVMRYKTKNIRRATQDLDIDFIRYSLENESLNLFIKKINCIPSIHISIMKKIEELKQQNYQGKRIYIKIQDSFKNMIHSKIDIGVHNKLEIEQEEYCFDIALNDEGVNLLINSNEQMFCEKLKSLLKFGTLSTRYKDVFDMYYLMGSIQNKKLNKCLDVYIFQDTEMREKNKKDIMKRLNNTFTDKVYQKRIEASNKNWLDIEIKDIFNKIISFLETV